MSKVGVGEIGDSGFGDHKSNNHGDSAPPRTGGLAQLPAFLWVLIGFLTADSVRKLAALGSDGALMGDRFIDIVMAALSLLLVFQLMLRSVTARIWGTVYCWLEIFYFVVRFCYRDPQEWLAATAITRLIWVLRISLFASMSVLLNTGASARTLRG